MSNNNQDEEVKSRIIELINDFRRRYYFEAQEVRKYSEEDVKVKLIFPLFEILGWNTRDHRETRMEFEEYDATVAEKGFRADCIFKIDNRPHIVLEAKRFDMYIPAYGILDSKTFAYAKKLEAKHVLITNFLQMSIADVETKRLAIFEDFSDYISKYDKLKVLMKPNVQEDNIPRLKPRGCFENFRPEECDNNCVPMHRLICEASTKLRQLGYEMKSYS